MPLPPHNHPLDDKLHEACPMCAEIVARRDGTAARERAADQNAGRHAATARKGRDG